MPRALSVQQKVTHRRPKFHSEGQYIIGRLLDEVVTRQATDFESGKPKYYDEEESRPVMEHIYDLLLIKEGPPCPKGCHYCKMSKQRDDEDTGVRRIYANWAQHNAIQQAFRDEQAKKNELFLGGKLMLKYEADDLSKKKGNKAPPKIWAAVYANPDAEDERVVDAYEAKIKPSNNNGSTSLTSEEAEELLNSAETVARTESSGSTLSFEDLQRLAKESQ